MEEGVAVFKDVNDLLDRIPIWKRLQGLPDRVDVLEAKVAALEEKLNGKYPADVCRKCGDRAMRLNRTMGPNTKGNMIESWKCEKCGSYEERQIKP